MAWKNLPTDYTDAVWTGLRKYVMINNDDDTISLRDVTAYSNHEKSFFGAKDANTMNDAINQLMGANFVEVADNAGAHNSIYRGKYLGNAVTPEQYAAISSGKFTDLYIGDYWTIGGVNYRIAAFDYYLNCGGWSITRVHHAVIVPDAGLYNHVMNDTDTATGGYKGSKMYKEGLTQAKTIIKEAFRGHVLSHQIPLIDSTSNGRPSGYAFTDSEVDLLSEGMVYGGGIYTYTRGSVVTIEKSQLPLFLYDHPKISNGSWWLRDVINSTSFAVVVESSATIVEASASLGVRPVFCIN